MMLNKNFTGRKGRAPGEKKMLRAKHLWRLHIGIRKTYPEYSSLWRPVSTCTESGRLMIGLFFIGIVFSIIILAILIHVRKYDS